MESVNTVEDMKLFNSSFLGDLEGVMDALAQGGRVTVIGPQGGTPLSAAAQEGHTDICGLLLAHGSDVNEVHLKSKATALHGAAAIGHEALVEALLSWGAIVDPQDHAGLTPLHLACQDGHLACVLALLKAGASLFKTDIKGALPIHKAAGKNRVETVRTLLANGCSPNTVSCSDNILIIKKYEILSPFSWTVGQGRHYSCLQHLKQLTRQWPFFSPKELILILWMKKVGLHL